MAQLPPPQQREYRKRLMTQPYREPERVMQRSGVRDERRTAQSMPEAQYRSAAQPDPRSRSSERLAGASRRDQPQPQQTGRSPEQDFGSVRSESRPNGIPIIERKPAPAYRRQDVDGRYGPAPSVSAPPADRGRTPAAPTDQNDGSMKTPTGQASDRRPTFEEFLRAEQSNAEVGHAPAVITHSGCLSRALRLSEHACFCMYRRQQPTGNGNDSSGGQPQFHAI